MDILKKIIPNRYTIIILILLIFLYTFSIYIFNLEPNYKWWHGLIMFCIAEYVGSVIYSTKHGFNLRQLGFIDNIFNEIEQEELIKEGVVLKDEILNQFFVVTITLDFKGNNISLLGNFDNYLNLTERELKILLFDNLDVRNVVKSIYRKGLCAKSLKYKQNIVGIRFKIWEDSTSIFI